MKFLVLCGLLAYCLIPCAAQQLGDIKAQGKLFGGYTTRTRLSTLTSTVLYTCASQVGQGGVPATCGGKRKKRAIVQVNMDPEEVQTDDLSSSHNIEERSAEDPKGKLFIALTTFTTITSTEFSTNQATTVSVSFSCLPLGDTVPPACG